MSQLFAEVYNCDDAIKDEEFLINLAKSASEAVGATVIGKHAVHYEPFGITIVVFLAESHILFTTWPEHSLLLVDILLCNPQQEPAHALDKIVAGLGPKAEVVEHKIERVIARKPQSD